MRSCLKDIALEAEWEDINWGQSMCSSKGRFTVVWLDLDELEEKKRPND